MRYWHSEADGPHGANVLVVDSARGDVQLWLRERGSGSVVSWGPIDGGRRIELWVSTSESVAADLKELVDEFKVLLPGEEERGVDGGPLSLLPPEISAPRSGSAHANH